MYLDLTSFAMAQAVVAGLILHGGGSNPCKFCGGQSVYETGFFVE